MKLCDLFKFKFDSDQKKIKWKKQGTAIFFCHYLKFNAHDSYDLLRAIYLWYHNELNGLGFTIKTVFFTQLWIFMTEQYFIN